MQPALRSHHRELPRPSGPFPDLQGVHSPRVPLDRRRLRHHHVPVLHLLRHCLPLRRQVRGLDGHQEGLPHRHRRVEPGRRDARRMRHRHHLVCRWGGLLGRAARRGGRFQRGAHHFDRERVPVPAVPGHPGAGRIGQLPGRHQDHGGVLSQERPCLRYVHLQRGSIRGRPCGPPAHTAAGQEFRLGDGLHHHRRPGIHLDVLLAVHVRQAGEEPQGERGGAGLHPSGR